MKTILVVIAIALVTTAGWAADVAPARGGLELDVRGAASYGFLSGYQQIPRGGGPGTTSHRRPSFDELGIEDAVFYDGSVGVRWRSVRFYGGAQFISLDSSGTLGEPLVTHGESFAAGDRFDTESCFDWYRAGVGWRFRLLNHRLEVLPKLELALLDFDYKFATAAQSVDRGFKKAAGRIGVEGNWRVNRVVSLGLDMAASVPLQNMPQIATILGTVNCDLLPSSQRVRPRLFLGTGAESIEYKDKQELPNHLKLDLGPVFFGGFSLSF